MSLARVLVAHGTRDAAGGLVAAELAERVGARLCFADVGRPRLADALTGLGPASVLPAFLAAGYHVRVDLPRQLAAAGRRDVLLTEPLAGHPALLDVICDRLAEAGWAPGDAMLLAAAGSSDPRAVADVRRAARALSRRVGRRVPVGFVATGSPRVPELVARIRATGERRVMVASWLLGPGVFQRSLAGCGAEVVTEPLGVHPGVLAALTDRFSAATRRLAA